MDKSKIDRSMYQKAKVEASEKEHIAAPASTMLADAWIRLKKNKAAVVALFILVAIILLAIFAPIFSKYSFRDTDYNNVYGLPSAAHIFGADQFGRDLWVRTWMGTRISLMIALVAAVLDLVVGVLYGGGALQKLLEQPAIAQHTGQAGHQALGLALAGTGSIDHAVQICAAFRAQGQILDIRLPQAVLFQILQPGQVLVLLHKGQQGIVGAHGSHGGGLGHAPRKNFGVLPQIQAVLHKVAFKAVLTQGAVFHLLQKLGLQALFPHGQVGLYQRRNKGQVSHGQNLPSG